MSEPTPIEALVERVDRLLVRYEELQRTNQLLVGQVDELTAERDQLKQRLLAARTRVDALLERIGEPVNKEDLKDSP
ncbi:cell division protein ZapB [Hylemonella sp. W303a]|uniref:cell division protein ZapB n=1 Tax=Hylemonella sp. W303a TaxID=3389873 RepID=UPI00396B3A17